MFDCIIVGAGPAGGAAAYHLAKRGHSVLVVEKDAWPRQKPCGGGVSPAIAKWFDFDLTPAISTTVEKIRYTWKLGDPVETEIVKPMWMVRRDIFDQYLMQQAVDQGAKLQTQTEVTGIKFKGSSWQVSTNAEPLEAKYLIAADGAKGPMAKWLGLKQSTLRQSMVAEFPSSPGQIPSFEFGMVKNGSIWGFPKADSYSISIATFRGGESKDLNKDLIQYASKLGMTTYNSISEHPLCLWDGDKTLHTQNALLAGDAASLADPLSAEGIRPSILSGVKAAEAIDQALETATPFILPEDLAKAFIIVARTGYQNEQYSKFVEAMVSELKSVLQEIKVKPPTNSPEEVARVLQDYSNKNYPPDLYDITISPGANYVSIGGQHKAMLDDPELEQLTGYQIFSDQDEDRGYIVRFYAPQK